MVLYACPAVAPYLQLARTMPGVVLGNRNTGYYYRPQVDELVRKLSDGDGLSALILKKEAQKQLIVNLHLDTSSMEARRRPVRWELIRCAKHFWEGKDPYPAPMHLQGADDDPMDGNRADVRPHPSTFRCFRTRFAPTKLLETFLFPPSSLVAKPSELPYNSAKGWLEDPSKELRHTNEFDGLTQEWYITKAYDMVDRLTNFHYVRYCKSGYGGFVDTWNKAAYEYHLSCLEHEVSVGNTLRLWDEDLQIERVKMELGIPDDAVGVPPGERATVAQLKSHNRHAPLIKIFNDLMRETCFVCPVTMSHFNPHGFKGLLDHVKNVHTKEYWTKNLSCVG
ncbi:MAG: hypothetical protein M1833_002410 [Piccolia ochrophora]|nr:MAG: hypothetical protein M1833_002410 [Piccolia ochrophora]